MTTAGVRYNVSSSSHTQGYKALFWGARDYGLCFTTHSSGYQNTRIAKTVGSASQPNHNITLAIFWSLISSIGLNRLTFLVCVVVGFPSSEGATGASSVADDEQTQHPLTTEENHRTRCISMTTIYSPVHIWRPVLVGFACHIQEFWTTIKH